MTSKLCAVIDYGMGNLHSAAKALEHVAPDTRVLVTSDPQQILAADHVFYPGVGAIRDCVGEVRRLGFDQVILEACRSKPLLAVCVGMQALMSFSEENDGVECLDWFPGRVEFFGQSLMAEGEPLKVPHMGWNQVQQVAHPLWQGIADESRFYFVHSYAVQAAEVDQVMGWTDYGKRFVAAIGQANVFAVQFHPEKSHTAGLQLLKNFLAWDGTI